MTASRFQLVGQVYQCLAQCGYTSTSVQFAAFGTFSGLLDQLRRTLGESVEDDFWPKIIGPLRRFWFDIAAAPLPDTYLRGRLEVAAELVRSNSTTVAEAYPSALPALEAIGKQMSTMAAGKLDLLLGKTVEVVQTQGSANTALLILPGRVLTEVEEVTRSVGGLQGCQVLSLASLREDHCYNRLLMFGAPHWYPDSVFSAPRAKEINVIKYKWMRGVWKPKMVFAQVVKPVGQNVANREMVETADESIDVDLDKLLPDLNWARISAQIRNEVANSSSYETITSRPYILEGDWVVFLEADPEASALVLDVREDAASRVKRVELRELEPEMFILLRTAGGGDYILPVANQLLGGFAKTAREQQQHWKSRLRAAVKARGTRDVIAQLKQFGSRVASPLNVSNWMWPRSIKTRDYEDFLAIMRLVGLESHAPEYWQTMRRISEAHTSAGHEIRDMLLAQVNKMDLRVLQRKGMMTFELLGEDAGSLTAFRINEILKEKSQVTIWRVGVPMKAGQ